MSIFHLSTRTSRNPKTGKAISALNHYEYITRQGKYSATDDLTYMETGKLPNCKEMKIQKDFWKAADDYKRKNGRTYREITLGLQEEFTKGENIELIHKFLDHFGIRDSQVYAFAIHDKQASYDPHHRNVHCHIMFNERTLSERKFKDPREVFSRWAGVMNQNEKGGLRIDRYFNGKNFVKDMRNCWERLNNEKFEELGMPIRISQKTLKAQREELLAEGRFEEAEALNRDAAPHMGPGFKYPDTKEEVMKLADKFEDELTADQVKAKENVIAALKKEGIIYEEESEQNENNLSETNTINNESDTDVKGLLLNEKIELEELKAELEKEKQEEDESETGTENPSSAPNNEAEFSEENFQDEPSFDETYNRQNDLSNDETEEETTLEYSNDEPDFKNEIPFDESQIPSSDEYPIGDEPPFSDENNFDERDDFPFDESSPYPSEEGFSDEEIPFDESQIPSGDEYPIEDGPPFSDENNFNERDDLPFDESSSYPSEEGFSDEEIPFDESQIPSNDEYPIEDEPPFSDENNFDERDDLPFDESSTYPPEDEFSSNEEPPFDEMYDFENESSYDEIRDAPAVEASENEPDFDEESSYDEAIAMSFDEEDFERRNTFEREDISFDEIDDLYSDDYSNSEASQAASEKTHRRKRSYMPDIDKNDEFAMTIDEMIEELDNKKISDQTFAELVRLETQRLQSERDKKRKEQRETHGKKATETELEKEIFEMKKELLARDIMVRRMARLAQYQRAELNKKRYKRTMFRLKEFGFDETIATDGIIITVHDVCKEMNALRKKELEKIQTLEDKIDIRNEACQMYTDNKIIAINEMTNDDYNKELIKLSKIKEELSNIQKDKIDPAHLQEYENQQTKINELEEQKNRLEQDIKYYENLPNNKIAKFSYDYHIEKIIQRKEKAEAYNERDRKVIAKHKELAALLQKRAEEFSKALPKETILYGENVPSKVYLTYKINGEPIKRMPFIENKEEIFFIVDKPKEIEFGKQVHVQCVKLGEEAPDGKAKLYDATVLIEQKKIGAKGIAVPRYIPMEIVPTEKTALLYNIDNPESRLKLNPSHRNGKARSIRLRASNKAPAITMGPAGGHPSGQSVLTNLLKDSVAGTATIKDKIHQNEKSADVKSLEAAKRDDVTKEMARQNEELENGEFIRQMRQSYGRRR